MHTTAQFRSGNTARATSILCTALALACGSATDPVLLAWEGDLEPAGPGGVSGSVGVASQYGRTEASILIEGGQPEATYQWRINEGGCAAAGEVIGGRAVYPELTTQTGAAVSADATIAGMLDGDTPYAARVLVAGTGGGESVIACGELERIR
jgi:hypothetical protein